MGDKQYALHSRITFVPPIKPVCSPMYPLNPTHVYITVVNRQYQNKLHDCHLVKNMNIYLNKIAVTAIDDQWIKESKDMVMEYSKKSFVEIMGRL